MPLPDPYLVIDVSQHVLPGTDITSALQRLLDEATPGTQFYFPAGTYVLGNLVIGSRPALHVEARNITFFGDGAQSVLQRNSGGLPRGVHFAGGGPFEDAVPDRIAIVNRGTDVTFRSLAFDVNGLNVLSEDPAAGSGAIFFYDCARLRVCDTLTFDSRFQHPERFDPLRTALHPAVSFPLIHERDLADRTAFLFVDSTDVWLEGNVVTDSQISFAGCSRVTIAHNAFRNPIFRAIKIGGLESPFGSLGTATPLALDSATNRFDGRLDSDYEVVDNIIENPWTHGVHCGNGPYSDPEFLPERSLIVRIRIAGNIIKKAAEMTSLPDIDLGAEGRGADLHEELRADATQRSRTYGCGILVGVADLPTQMSVRDSPRTPDTFEHIVVESNMIYFWNPMTTESHGIRLNGLRWPIWPVDPNDDGSLVGEGPQVQDDPQSALEPVYVPIRKAVVRNNHIDGVANANFASGGSAQPNGHTIAGIYGTYLEDSVIAGNGVFGGAFGIVLLVDLRNHVYANRVKLARDGNPYVFHAGGEELSGDSRYALNATLGIGTSSIRVLRSDIFFTFWDVP